MADISLAKSPPEKTRLSGFVDGFTEWSLNWVPDSMVFVLVLTVIVYGLAIAVTNHGPLQLIDDYAKGAWVLLSFSMQMSLLLITGFAVADAKIVKNAIIAFISWPKTRTGTVLLYIITCSVLWWAHWGIGTMASIIMGREIAARRGDLKLHYPFMAAVAYGVVVFSNGPSQSAQLLVATPGHFMEKVTGIIPLTQTAFSPFLLTTMLILLVTYPIVLLAMMPKAENSVGLDEKTAAEFMRADAEEKIDRPLRPAEKWDRSRWLQSFVALGGLIWMARYIMDKGVGQLNLDTLNFIFLFIGMMLHGSPQSFINSIKKAVPAVYGIIIQFPMYAGIFGMIQHSGLAGTLAHFFVSISTTRTFPWIVFLYTGIVDFFVPSGGAKFAIEAPYLFPAAQQLGVSQPQVVVAYTAGSLWVNLVQPFWALPILASFKVRFQDILPYTFAVFVLNFVVFSAMLLIFPNGF